MRIKIIWTVATLIGLLAGGSLSAQGKPASSIAVPTTTNSTVFVRPFCKFGLQFLASSIAKSDTNSGSGGVSVVQVIGTDGKPMQCTEDIK